MCLKINSLGSSVKICKYEYYISEQIIIISLNLDLYYYKEKSWIILIAAYSLGPEFYILE